MNIVGLRLARVPSGAASPEAKMPPVAVAPFTDADVKRVAALPAAEQVEAVRKELVRRNPGFDGKVEHKIEGGVVTEFRIVTDKVTDIAPLRVFNALRVLDCSGSYVTWEEGNGRLTDLTPLKGMNLSGLTELKLQFNKVDDEALTQFKDCKKLTVLALGATKVSDSGLAYLKDCKNLNVLWLVGTKVTDAGLAHFADCNNLTSLNVGWTKVTGAGLAKIKSYEKLEELDLGRISLSDADLALFKDCRNLRSLWAFDANVTDAGLANFKDRKLEVLDIRSNPKTTDFSLLKGRPLKFLGLDFRPERDAEILRSIKTLETVNDKPAAEFWKEVEQKQAADQAWLKRVAALPAAEQVEAVRKELVRRNPGFDGKVEHKIEGGVVTEFRIVTDKVTDIAPIRVWSALRVLDCSGTYTDKPDGLLADLTPLGGMNLAALTHLNLDNTKVTDAGMVYFKDCKNLTHLSLERTLVTDAGLAHFKDCKSLTSLDLGSTRVSDAGLIYFKDCKALTVLYLHWTNVGDVGLVHFKDCKDLTDLSLASTKVSDVGLARFKNCKNLTRLDVNHTQVGDAGLAHFKGMPLTWLWIDDTGITDLNPLQGMLLEEIHLTPKKITRGLDILRDMKSLKTIGIAWKQDWPAAEFWERYDKREFKK